MSDGRGFGRTRPDPGMYYLRVFGEPGGKEPWSWRFGGRPCGCPTCGAPAEAVRLSRAPEGIAGTDLSDAQRRLLQALLDAYVGSVPDELAGPQMERYTNEALFAQTHFAWAGPTSGVRQRPEPGRSRTQRAARPGWRLRSRPAGQHRGSARI
jgi:hypothetical protein